MRRGLDDLAGKLTDADGMATGRPAQPSASSGMSAGVWEQAARNRCPRILRPLPPRFNYGHGTRWQARIKSSPEPSRNFVFA
jgi:hypothetical protein